jgi:hypothetical protein
MHPAQLSGPSGILCEICVFIMQLNVRQTLLAALRMEILLLSRLCLLMLRHWMMQNICHFPMMKRRYAKIIAKVTGTETDIFRSIHFQKTIGLINQLKQKTVLHCYNFLFNNQQLNLLSY